MFFVEGVVRQMHVHGVQVGGGGLLVRHRAEAGEALCHQGNRGGGGEDTGLGAPSGIPGLHALPPSPEWYGTFTIGGGDHPTLDRIFRDWLLSCSWTFQLILIDFQLILIDLN